MSNYKTVFFTLGILQIILGIFMLIPIITQFFYNEIDSSFFGASIVTIIFGTLFFLSNLDHDKKLNLQQAFLLTALFGMIVEPVVVIPDILSKKAFVKEKLRLEKTKGKEPKIAILIQDRAVNKNACCKFNFLSWSKFERKNNVPKIIVTIDAPKKDESISL